MLASWLLLFKSNSWRGDANGSGFDVCSSQRTLLLALRVGGREWFVDVVRVVRR